MRKFLTVTVALTLLAAIAGRAQQMDMKAQTTTAAGPIGAGVTLKDATPIKALYEHPEKYLNKKVRIDGVVTGVCEDMGCWMALASPDNPAQTVRLKVEEHGPIVFPMSAMGKHASAEGVFMKLPTTGDAKEAAAEEAKGKTPSAFAATYQVKATGAVIR